MLEGEMKGKTFVLGVMLLMFMAFFGCSTNTRECVLQNMSETTKDFYFGENTKLYATLAVGEREKEYVMDGKSNSKIDFSLLSLVFFENLDKNVVEVVVTIGDDSDNFELEYNSMTNMFMVDLEKKIEGDKRVWVKYDGMTIELSNLSKKFAINWENAIAIACDEMSDKIEKEKQYNDLNGECYLKVMDKRANNFQEFFWCFTILNNQNESFSIIISTTDGSVLAKSK